MKLSAKLFTALAALALLVVAVVGTSQTTQAADADGAVYLTNKWSKLTTNPDGFDAGGTILADETYVGSGKSLFATFVEKTSAGTSTQTIETDADVLIVTVVDADQDIPVAKTLAAQAWVKDTNEGLAINLQALMPAGSLPILDIDGDGAFYDDVTITGTVSTTSTLWSVSVDNPDSGIIRVYSTGAVTNASQNITIAWQTSGQDTIPSNATSTITVKSTQDSTGIEITLLETGNGTGIFRGEVQLIDAEVTGAVSTTTGGNKLVVLNNGSITATYVDNAPTTGTTASVSATAVAETNVPQVTVTGPATDSATQDRRPAFAGSATDSGSGLMLDSSVLLFIDDGNDAANTTPVDVAVGSTDQNTPVVPAAAADGDASVAWTFTPGVDLPTGFTTGTVDNLVDWQVRANDLAGNVGYSDADGDLTDNLCATGGTCTDPGDAPGEGVVPGRGEPHVVKVDQLIPSIAAAYTGHYWDAAVATPVRKANRATALEVVFDGPMLASAIDNTDFEVVIDSVTHVPSAVSVVAAVPNSVWLTVGTDIPSDDTPTVKVVNQISDTAGNTANSGSKVAVDSLAPVITLALGGGSAVTNPAGLTKADITATITSDESLSDIRIKVYKPGSIQDGVDLFPVNQGGNVYEKVIKGAGQTAGKLSVTVEATDSATAATMDFDNDATTLATAVSPSTRVQGDDDTTDDDATVYTLDTTVPVMTTVPANAGTTSETSPFVTLDFGEDVTITKAEFDDVDVAATLVTTDDEKWIYRAVDLALGDHEVIGKATDLAGNVSAETTSTFEVIARDDFELALVAGWNAVSVPADPVVVDIDSVFTNTAIDQVIAYDATHAASPWRIATKDSATGLFVSTTELSLNSVRQGVGYWVHTDNFEAQDIALTPPIGPGSASPPAVLTIPTGNGWNFIGVISVSGANTTGASGLLVDTAGAYFTSVNWSRAYSYNATALQFVEVGTAGNLNTGQGVWVFVSPQADGSLPAIVP